MTVEQLSDARIGAVEEIGAISEIRKAAVMQQDEAIRKVQIVTEIHRRDDSGQATGVPAHVLRERRGKSGLVGEHVSAETVRQPRAQAGAGLVEQQEERLTYQGPGQRCVTSLLLRESDWANSRSTEVCQQEVIEYGVTTRLNIVGTQNIVVVVGQWQDNVGANIPVFDEAAVPHNRADPPT